MPDIVPDWPRKKQYNAVGTEYIAEILFPNFPTTSSVDGSGTCSNCATFSSWFLYDTLSSNISLK